MIDPHSSSEPAADFADEAEVVVYSVDGSAFRPRKRDTPEEILRSMKSRLKYLGSPLPDGYVPPPGIDIDALLRQLPPRPGT